MTTSDENFDPRSLPNLSNLLTHSAHNKCTANKGPLTNPGLKETFLHNITTQHHITLECDLELPIPTLTSPQPIVVSHDKVTEEMRLPISPPPEEEIRIKQLGTHGITPKEPNSRLPLRSRPGAFKVPGLPQSFAHLQQQARQHASAGQGSVPAASVPPSASTASKPNPRKRTRSVLPSAPPHGDSESMHTDPTSPSQSSTMISSPNPRARKQPKKHDAGIYTGSGFKRRHKRGTSTESLDGVDDERITSPVSASLKSPARKKRHDPGIVDYTPEREHALSFSRGSATKRKPQAQRSLTPEVRYEPPTEQFTPPREVVLQIPSSTVSSRSRDTKPSVSTAVKSSIDRKVVKVKTERLTSPFPLPPLDLSKPVPPASPTDDPLLLVGPPVIVRRSATPAVVPIKTLVDASAGNDEEIPHNGPSTPVRVSPMIDLEVDQSLWKFAPDLMDGTALIGVAFDGPSTFDATFHSDDSDDGNDIKHDAAHNRPHTTSAPVGFDPDQSTGSHIFFSDDEGAMAGEDEGEFTGRFKFYSVPVKQDPPSSATRARRESWGRPISPFPFAKRSGRPSSSEESLYRQVPLDEDSPPPSPSVGRRRSVLPIQDLEAAPCSNSNGVYDKDVPSPGVVEVSSDDPKAAARAAAILKLHHSYILDGDIALRARHRSFSGFLNRSSLTIGDRNMDSDHDEEFIRRTREKSIDASVGVMQHRPRQMGPSPLIGSTLIAPRSPSLPAISPEDALKEAETEIRAACASPGRLGTPLRSISLATHSHGDFTVTPLSHANYHPQTDEPPNRTGSIKEWTKAHWKTLDMCFTDERLGVGSAMGLNNRLAEVDEIEIGSVVERFLAQMKVDEDWDRDMLLRRATALSHRQRAGKGAPPSPSQLLSQNTAPEVPALTPPTISRALSPASETGIPTKLPPSLFAPRYAHLHKEVTTAPSAPPEIPTSGSIIVPGRTRKVSGSSVKDLIKSFEALQKTREEEMKRSNSRLGVRKVASVGNFSGKPLWKP